MCGARAEGPMVDECVCGDSSECGGIYVFTAGTLISGLIDGWTLGPIVCDIVDDIVGDIVGGVYEEFTAGDVECGATTDA